MAESALPGACYTEIFSSEFQIDFKLDWNRFTYIFSHQADHIDSLFRPVLLRL